MKESFVSQATFLAVALTVAVSVVTPGTAVAGRILVSNDEWNTTNFGFGETPAGSEQFVLNVAEWFAGSPSGGNFLVYSDNFSLAPSAATQTRDTVEGAGHTWTSYGGTAFNLAALLSYDGVFLALPATPAISNIDLIDYVNAGGSVYLAGGTGFPAGAASEAAAWNPFLNTFGLQFEAPYNLIIGSIGISNPLGHPVLDGVTELYQNNGNSVSFFGSVTGAQIIESSNGDGLYGVFESSGPPEVIPEPATSALIGAGLFAIGWLAHRRRAWNKPSQTVQQ
jgi:hypothetical protein